MKTKLKFLTGMLKIHLPSLLIMLLLSLSSSAQWTTNVNNIYNSNTGNVGIGTNAPATKLQVIGESRFGAAGNYTKVNSTGTLSFVGTGFYSVAANKYVFKQASSGNRGLYVNKVNTRFEFRDSLANDLFHIDYYTGDVFAKSKLSIGTNSAIPSDTRLMVGGIDATEGGQIQLNPGSFYPMAYFMDVSGNDFRIKTGYSNATNVTTRFTINDAGHAGIRTSDISPESDLALGGGTSNSEGGQLQLNGSPTNQLTYYLDVHDDDFRIMTGDNQSSSTVLLQINQDGNVGIGTTTPSAKLTVFNNTTTGTYTTTGWMHSSDARLKTNIKPLANALDKIVKLQGVSYNWKTNPNGNNQIGFIAQEVEKVFPEVINKDPEGNYSMAIQNLVAPVVEAIKEQQTEIKEKDETIKNLQLAVGSLQNENALLKSRLENSENALSQCCTNYKQGAANSEPVSEEIAKLEQNSPNPFNGIAIIRCYIPQSASKAILKIYSLTGEEIKSVSVNGKGVNELEIAGNTLSAGTYNYLLIVDGKTIDTKQMILTK
jgi:hypothetical protein